MSTDHAPETPSPVLRAAVGFIAYLAIGPVLLFVSAGDGRWIAAWILVGVSLLGTAGSRLAVFLISRDLLAERARSVDAADAPAWDKVLVPLVALLLPVATCVVAGADHRLGWSPPMAGWLTLAGGLCVAASYALAGWAMAANRYFSATVRIQSERGHQVISSGPYAVVRHPGYAGVILYAPGAPLLLGSLWALVPSAFMLALVVVRTSLEDRYLREHLPGYAEYAERVRYRLLPGLW